MAALLKYRPSLKQHLRYGPELRQALSDLRHIYIKISNLLGMSNRDVVALKKAVERVGEQRARLDEHYFRVGGELPSPYYRQHRPKQQGEAVNPFQVGATIWVIIEGTPVQGTIVRNIDEEKCFLEDMGVFTVGQLFATKTQAERALAMENLKKSLEK